MDENDSSPVVMSEAEEEWEVNRPSSFYLRQRYSSSAGASSPFRRLTVRREIANIMRHQGRLSKTAGSGNKASGARASFGVLLSE